MGVIVAGGAVWANVAKGRMLARIDPATDAVSFIKLDYEPYGGLAANERTVWSTGGGGGDVVARIDAPHQEGDEAGRTAPDRPRLRVRPHLGGKSALAERRSARSAHASRSWHGCRSAECRSNCSSGSARSGCTTTRGAFSASCLCAEGSPWTARRPREIPDVWHCRHCFDRDVERHDRGGEREDNVSTHSANRRPSRVPSP